MPANVFWSLTFSRPVVACAAMMFAVLPNLASAQEPLHQRIDQLVNAAPLGPVAAICSDAEFLPTPSFSGGSASTLTA
ncbi:MAG: hypothetical protein FD138_3955 [Planctomycetota bacterium]|nr:MAG: hypothetical protein FD138_3955 [Planctomycetota bacterium]